MSIFQYIVAIMRIKRKAVGQMKDIDIYRNQIIKMIKEIESRAILRCIFVFINDIMEEKEENKRKENCNE